MKRRLLLRRKDGIRQHYRVGRKMRIRRMAAEYRIPHWLLRQLNDEQRKEAEYMLFEQKLNIGVVAEHFGIKHPSEGVMKKPFVSWTEERRKQFILNLANELGRPPLIEDVDWEDDIPSRSTFTYKHNWSWNEMLKAYGFDIPDRNPTMPISERISKFGHIPTAEEVNKAARDRLEKTEKIQSYRKEYRERPEVKEHFKEYLKKWDKGPVRQAYLSRPEVKKAREESSLRAYYKHKSPKKNIYLAMLETLENPEEVEKSYEKEKSELEI